MCSCLHSRVDLPLRTSNLALPVPPLHHLVLPEEPAPGAHQGRRRLDEQAAQARLRSAVDGQGEGRRVRDYTGRHRRAVWRACSEVLFV